MELNLQPRAPACFVSGQPFQEGDRVASILTTAPGGAVVRYDLLEANAADFKPEGFVACRWVQVYKANLKDENKDRTLKLTAENLFLTLSDPSTLSTPETDRLIRFLALLLERKRLLRPKGVAPDGVKDLYEHAKTKMLHEVPSIELTPEFFIAVREQLSVLVGEPKVAEPPPAAPAPEPVATSSS
jgi:hypothetical protein